MSHAYDRMAVLESKHTHTHTREVNNKHDALIYHHPTAHTISHQPAKYNQYTYAYVFVGATGSVLYVCYCSCGGGAACVRLCAHRLRQQQQRVVVDSFTHEPICGLCVCGACLRLCRFCDDIHMLCVCVCLFVCECSLISRDVLCVITS